MLKKNKNINNNIKIKTNKFWRRFMKKDYLFAKFFFTFLDFFIYIAKKIKIPVVNKYHQNKVLSVSKKC
ncbi:unnamed protein product [Staurois parvus]|uniref:Uncharacterized protein n=1 Tax=Staurois parvus TaxID=386267 RepID=A0ABN9F5V4_9NEOB|nr:unnamed protein product [Staurois parvus]